MAKKINYINNKTLYASMVEHRAKLAEAIEQGKQKPQISRYVGESILKICNNLAKKPNFSGYTYKLDMISDAIVDCVAAVDNFDPNRTNNPFAYFTQIAWNAFLRRLQKEKIQTYAKHKNFENSFLTNQLWSDSENIHLKANEYSSEVISSFEEKVTKNKLTKKKKASNISIIESCSADEVIDETSTNN